MDSLLDGLNIEPRPQVLWSLHYHQADAMAGCLEFGGNTICLPPLSSDLALSDAVLEDVQQAWSKITGEGEDSFLKFVARQGMEDDE